MGILRFIAWFLFITQHYTNVLCHLPKMSSGASDISKMGLWGNYSIPKDNPFREDKELEPEIWAVGMRNPWRCSFDASRPSYFMCADVGQVNGLFRQ